MLALKIDYKHDLCTGKVQVYDTGYIIDCKYCSDERSYDIAIG